MSAPPLRIINAPFDLCGRSPGSRLGPVAAKLAGLFEELGHLGLHLDEAEGGWEMDSRRDFRCTEPVSDLSLKAGRTLKAEVLRSLEKGALPLVIGGDHSLSIGSVSAALARYGADLGVLWIDAHMDLNTPDVSVTKNIHGMPLAALLRLPEKEESVLTGFWEKVLEEVVPDPGLSPHRVGWLGLREVDDAEGTAFHSLGGAFARTMDDIDREGLARSLDGLEAWLQTAGIKKLWVSFDVDSLDPFFAPGTGTAVRGGLTYREGHLLAERLHEMLFAPGSSCSLAGLDVVEINPLLDHENTTARMAVGWLASLFGKRILKPLR